MSRLVSLVIILFLFVDCSNSKTESSDVLVTTERPAEGVKNAPTTISGFDSIEALAASALKSIKNSDHKSYYSHVMSKDMEMRMANMIKDSTVHDEFIHEYGFSLKEEKEYFDYLIKYFNDKNIDLNKAVLASMEYTEYKSGKYEPVMLYEVFIPIEMEEYETLIDLTAIEVDGKYFLTSELGF